MVKDIFNKTKVLFNKIIKGYESFINKKPFYYVTQFFPKNILLLVLFLFVFYLGAIKIKHNDITMYMTTYDSFDKKIINESIIQNIDSKKVNRFNKMGIIVKNENNSTAKYKVIINKNNKNIKEDEIDASTITGQQLLYFNYDEVLINKDDDINLEIKPINATEDNYLVIGTNHYNDTIYYELRSYSEFNKSNFIVYIVFLLIFLLINYLINNKIIKKHSSFYILMLIYIISTLIIIPPLQVPDEPYHFSKAYSMSQYNFSKSPYKNAKTKINSPKNIRCLYYTGVSLEKIIDDVSIKDKMIDCFKNGKNIPQKSFKIFNYSNVLGVIVPAIGIKIIDIFSNSPMILFYVGRLFNCLFSFLLIYFGIKKIPKYKNIVLLVSMIPMLIYQMISYSYDSLLNSLCIFVMCYLIYFMNTNEIIKKKDLIIYFIASLAIYNIKAPYIIIPLLIILVDKDKFGDKKIKKYLLILTSIAAIFFIGKVLTLFPNMGKTIDVKVASNPHSTKSNLEYLINNPTKIIHIAKNTILSKGKWYLTTMIGAIGWLRYLFEDKIVNIYIIALITSVFASDNKMSKIKRIIGLVFQLCLIGGIFLSMYLGWSSYALDYVEGVQGRYFIPLLIPIMFLLKPSNKIITIKDETVMQFINVIQLYSIIMLLVSFY